jgi:YVTN family beta-propeller protein
MHRSVGPLFALCLLACSDGSAPGSSSSRQLHSSALALSPDGSRLFVVHPDADSVSVLDVPRRRILHERLLTAAAPARDSAGRYEPAALPRALALDSTGARLFVTGQRSGRVYALEAATLEVTHDVFVCSEPIGVLVSGDDASLFVACAQDDEIVQLSAKDLALLARVPCPRKPWALAWDADSETLLATHLLGPGVSRFTTQPLALSATWTLAAGRPVEDPNSPAGTTDPTEPHGEVRGIYDILQRPGSTELWIPHLMLGIDTAQPALDFKRTAFAALSILNGTGDQLARLSVQAKPGDEGAFGDIISGPHALAFSDDGKLAFVVDANSEDVLVVDAEQRIEVQLLRPLPGHLPEAVVFAGGKIYVQERNSEDIAAFRVEQHALGVTLVPDGPPFATLHADPMPAELRLGQKLFYSANSDDLPITQNHWVACATCHIEGRSDAVTWLFGPGPRDTPSNAGGMLDTGFLFRTADRVQVQDYWRTINIEQGGHFNSAEPTQAGLLDGLAAYVNYAIPTPVPPSTDRSHSLNASALAELRARGKALFAQVGCGTCHSGNALTDSGLGNPDMNLAGPIVSVPTPGGVLLHDVGTCANGAPAPDVGHEDMQGNPRQACAFDTPQLRGLWDSAPYLHDGSAATLEDVLPVMLKAATAADQPVPVLSDADRTALLEYLRSL